MFLEMKNFLGTFRSETELVKYLRCMRKSDLFYLMLRLSNYDYPSCSLREARKQVLIAEYLRHFRIIDKMRKEEEERYRKELENYFIEVHSYDEMKLELNAKMYQYDYLNTLDNQELEELALENDIKLIS